MWLKRGRNAKRGDLVLIVENGPRNHWNLGRILEVQRDIHDIVRVVKVKTVYSYAPDNQSLSRVGVG